MQDRLGNRSLILHFNKKKGWVEEMEPKYEIKMKEFQLKTSPILRVEFVQKASETSSSCNSIHVNGKLTLKEWINNL